MLDEILQRRNLVFLAGYFDSDKHTPVPQGLEREYISGIHREPKLGVVHAPGSKRVPQPYIYEKGKKVSTSRTKRFAAR